MLISSWKFKLDIGIALKLKSMKLVGNPAEVVYPVIWSPDKYNYIDVLF
jgi:hypothetical protein